MDENELTKTEPWTERIKDFYTSGLSRKEWCRKHQISLSTFSYWIRKQAKKSVEPAIWIRIPAACSPSAIADAHPLEFSSGTDQDFGS